MPIADTDDVYDLLETTMRGYVEAVWGTWNNVYWRDALEDAMHRKVIEEIVNHGSRVGVIWIAESDSYWQIELICIEPKYQNKGIGEAAIRTVLAKAATQSKTVKLRVLAPNPAKRLYERLGFVVTKTTPERFYMAHYV